MAAALMGVGSMIPARVVQARDSVQTQGQTVETSALPREAVETLDEIHAGGPFRYSKDGVVFNNFERQLPARPRGYYHEYTVWTPTAHNRGARRIVCGGPPRTPDDCYYTGDHYQTFQRILE
jgi:ribonuclease T1